MVLLVGCGLTMLNLFLYEHDFASRCLLYLGEKALLVHDGKPPRLENMGFSSPPFPHFFVLLANNPFVATAFVGGMMITVAMLSLYRGLTKRYISMPLFSVLLCYLLLSPLSLFLFAQQLPDGILMGLLLLSYYHLFKYSEQEISYDLFLFGLLSAFLFLTKFQAVAVVPMFGIVLAAKYGRRHPLKGLAVLLTSLFPVIFISLSWCYLNWVFLGDPLYFLTHWNALTDTTSSISSLDLQPRDLEAGIKATIHFFTQNMPILLPYVLTGIWIFAPQDRPKKDMALPVFLTPMVFLLAHYMTTSTAMNQDLLLLFVATAVSIRIYCREQMGDSLFKGIFTLTMAISLVMSFWLPCSHNGSEEQLFCQVLTGERKHGNLTPYRRLLDRIRSQDHILMDDTSNYPLVFMTQEPKKFILPYEYEFEMILAAPQHFVRYIIVSDTSSQDRILGRYPLASVGIVPDFSLIGQFGNMYLYEASIQKGHGLHNTRLHEYMASK